jgi:O-succinylbenzoate synthase
MRIEGITLREIRMPLVHFFETSFGRWVERRILLATIHSEGIHGWGECSAGEDPFYSGECVETAWYIISHYLAPSLLGRNLTSAAECPGLFARVRANNMAKAVLENAAWDAEAMARDLPLWKLLGGTRNEIPCGVSIGIQDSMEQLLDKVSIELAAGYQRIKLKVKPGWDLGVLQRVRDRWPDITLSCDANSAYQMGDLNHLKKFDQFGLLMIEQPLWHDDLFFHAKLQSQIKTAICLDESIHNSRDARAAGEMRSCRIINIKGARVGGFSEAIQVHDVCQSLGMAVWCGGMLESGIGRSHNIALSTLPNFLLPGDISASKRYWREDIIEPEVEVSAQGTIAVSDKPGRGCQLREDLIEQLTVRKETFRPIRSAVSRS